MAYYFNIEFVDLIDKCWPQETTEKKELIQNIHVKDWDVCWEFEVLVNGPYKYVESFGMDMPFGHRCYDIWQGDDGVLIIKPLCFGTVVVQSTLKAEGNQIEASFFLSSGRCILTTRYKTGKKTALSQRTLEDEIYEALSEQRFIDSAGQRVNLLLPGFKIAMPGSTKIWNGNKLSQSALDAHLAKLRREHQGDTSADMSGVDDGQADEKQQDIEGDREKTTSENSLSGSGAGDHSNSFAGTTTGDDGSPTA